MTPSIIINPKVISELDEISDKNSKEWLKVCIKKSQRTWTNSWINSKRTNLIKYGSQYRIQWKDKYSAIKTEILEMKIKNFSKSNRKLFNRMEQEETEKRGLEKN